MFNGDFKDLTDRLIEALSAGDFSQAGELTTNLYMAVGHGLIEKNDGIRNQIHKNLNEISELLDRLLDLADQLFVTSPLENERRNFRDHLTQVSDILNKGTVDAANQARSFIEDTIKNHEERILQLEETGYYDRQTFCLFWKLWLLLDEMIRCPKFPRDQYEKFAVRLYGTISPALQSKQTVICLAKYRKDIFPSESGDDKNFI